MAKQTKEEKAMDARINKAFHARCNGIQIPIMDLPKIFRIGKEAATAGKSDEEIAEVMHAYVQTIRKN